MENYKWLRRWLYNLLFTRLSYFKEYYKLVSIDLSKQQTVDADPKAIQHISFIWNLDRTGNKIVLFIIEKTKETIFHKEAWEYCKRVPEFYFVLIWY